MDSDSSLDGSFETKHEIAVQSRHDNAGVKSTKEESSEEAKSELPDGQDSSDSDDDSVSSSSSVKSKSTKEGDDVLNLNCDVTDRLETKVVAIKEKRLSEEKVIKNEKLADLSDVSDLDTVSEEEGEERENPREGAKEGTEDTGDKKEHWKEEEQLDFEAEEQQDGDREEGECDPPEEPSEDEGELPGEELEEGELTDEDDKRPEETEPRPICRFYNRGQCTWGSSCRFLHPGVTDKGNYTMFDMVRPLVPVNGVPIYPTVDYRIPYEKPAGDVQFAGGHKEEPAMYESAWERGLRQAKEMMRKSTKRKETDMDFEEKKMNLSLGQEELDKENDYYTRPASPIFNEESDRWGDLGEDPVSHLHGFSKEPFLQKFQRWDQPMVTSGSISDTWSTRVRKRSTHAKLNGQNLVTTSCQDVPGESCVDPESRLRFVEPEGRYGHKDNFLGESYEEFVDSPHYYQSRSVGDYWRRVHYEPGDARALRVEADYNSSRSTNFHNQDYYEKYDSKKKSSTHTTREVIVQRSERPWREDRATDGAPAPRRGARGDEWADPWMRSKSPSLRKEVPTRSRRQSYSSGSSYSSSSSSRSSSQSSYSSYSHESRSRSKSKSRTRSRSRSSSRSRLSRVRRRPNRPLIPTARTAVTENPASLTAVRKIGKTPPEAHPFAKQSVPLSEKKVVERALLMNPPAPSQSPRKHKELKPLSPGMMRRAAQNPPAPASNTAKPGIERSKLSQPGAETIKSKRVRGRSSKSSKSSSGSDSSGSSSDTSESSYTSSSSSLDPSPKGIAVRTPKRIVLDERERVALAQSMKVKAMDALKLSGQKQQIKLTLKTMGNGPSPAKRPVNNVQHTQHLPELPELNLVRRELSRAVATAGKKRTAEDADLQESITGTVPGLGPKGQQPAAARQAAKKATSRREELLKQLKAVEDAIARKRSKI